MDEDLIVEDVRRDDRLLRKHGIVHDDDDAKASDSASSDDIDDETDIKPAWEDEDDKNLRIDISSGPVKYRKLRQTEDEKEVDGVEFSKRVRERLSSKASWAEVKSKRRTQDLEVEDDDDDESGPDYKWMEKTDAERRAELFSSASPMTASSTSKFIAPTSIDISRLRDANQQQYSRSAVRVVRFHPNGRVLMTAGLDKNINIFQIDGDSNPRVTSLHLRKFPIYCAEFSADGASIFASSRRNYYFEIDPSTSRVNKLFIQGRPEKSLEYFVVSPDNKYLVFKGVAGTMAFVCRKSKTLLFTLKCNCDIASMAFNKDGQYLYVTGSWGEVYTFDVGRRECVVKHMDEGSTKGTCVVVGHDIYGVGAKTGVINLYNVKENQTEKPFQLHKNTELEISEGNDADPFTASGAVSPIKTLMNLTTRIDRMAMSPDNQILAVSSVMKREALRLVHVASKTVYQNWPTSKTPLQYVTDLAWSPRGDMLAVGNAKGRVLLFRLNHYR